MAHSPWPGVVAVGDDFVYDAHAHCDCIVHIIIVVVGILLLPHPVVPPLDGSHLFRHLLCLDLSLLLLSKIGLRGFCATKTTPDDDDNDDDDNNKYDDDNDDTDDDDDDDDDGDEDADDGQQIRR